MDLVTWSLLLGSLALFVIYLINCNNYWRKRGVPTADGVLPYFGHTLPVITMRKNYGMVCDDIYKKFKDRSMVGLYNMRRPVLLLREPELIKTVLQTGFTNYHENGLKIDPELDPLLAKNPFFVYGDAWATGRKRLTYAFSSMRLKILFDTVHRVCGKLQNYLDKKLSQTGVFETELKELFSRYTGEVVANAGLGLEGFCFEDPQHPMSFQKIGSDVFKPTVKTGIQQAIVFFMPMLSKVLRVRFLPKYVHNFFVNVVKDVLKTRRSEATPRNDFFQLMIDMEKQQGEELDEMTLAAHALSFFVDGFETSSITLSFAGYQLAVHQDVQQKLREEIVSVLAKHNGELTYESLKEMTYMEQVISESQRLNPVLGILEKLCTNENELRGSDGMTIRVEPGTGIIIPLFGLHRDPKYWTDPETFDPERFNEERKKNITKYTFLPFGEGPRFCVGMRMAMLQMKACLAVLLKHYKLTLSPKTRLPLKLSGTNFLSAPIGGLWVNVEKL